MDNLAVAYYRNLVGHNLQTETNPKTPKQQSYLKPNNSVLLKPVFFLRLGCWKLVVTVLINRLNLLLFPCLKCCLCGLSKAKESLCQKFLTKNSI
jgi:hypothetical protein